MAQDGAARVSMVHEGQYLVASIHTALDDAQMVRFRSDLVEAVGQKKSRGVIIDVSALDVLDSFGAGTVRETAEMVRLRGARTVMVGVQPDVAFAMTRLGMGIGSIHTALDLEEGLDLLDRVNRSR